MDKQKMAKTLIKLRGNKSREQVSADLKISFSALCMYEQGNRVPRDEVKIRIANYYNRSVEDIFFN